VEWEQMEDAMGDEDELVTVGEELVEEGDDFR
jgi:hypothetical protein